MRANELMIGDWIYDNYHQAKARVNTLTRALLWAAVEEKDGSYDDKQLRYEDVQPIPLTTEILERNGFERTGSTYIMADDYYDITVHEVSDSIWEVIYTNCEMSLGSQQMYVCNVHQLQHALRMCDEEIEIRL